MRLLHAVNGDLARIHLSNSSDLYGQTYQQIISDRKKLTAFYTRPPSAALLAALSVPADKWHDAESLRQVRIADFAYGTGTLLHTAYRHLAAHYEIASGQPMAARHAHMMVNCLIGADVLPSATHLTAAVLSSTHPRQPYEQTCIHVAASQWYILTHKLRSASSSPNHRMILHRINLVPRAAASDRIVRYSQ